MSQVLRYLSPSRLYPLALATINSTNGYVHFLPKNILEKIEVAQKNVSKTSCVYLKVLYISWVLTMPLHLFPVQNSVTLIQKYSLPSRTDWNSHDDQEVAVFRQTEDYD